MHQDLDRHNNHGGTPGQQMAPNGGKSGFLQLDSGFYGGLPEIAT